MPPSIFNERPPDRSEQAGQLLPIHGFWRKTGCPKYEHFLHSTFLLLRPVTMMIGAALFLEDDWRIRRASSKPFRLGISTLANRRQTSPD